MERLRATDSLEVLGVGMGVLLVLGGLATVAGTPWTTAETTAAGIVSVLGALLAVAIGVGLAWLVRTGN